MPYWTGAAVTRAKELWDEGRTSREVADTLSLERGVQITRNAILGLAHRQGWSTRKPGFRSDLGVAPKERKAKLPPKPVTKKPALRAVAATSTALNFRRASAPAAAPAAAPVTRPVVQRMHTVDGRHALRVGDTVWPMGRCRTTLYADAMPSDPDAPVFCGVPTGSLSVSYCPDCRVNYYTPMQPKAPPRPPTLRSHPTTKRPLGVFAGPEDLP